MNKAWFQDRLQQLKLSQRKLAKLIEVDPAAVSYMFSGQRRMTMDEAQKIAGVLLVPVTEVMRQAGIEVLDDVRKAPIAGYLNNTGAVTLLPKGTHDFVVGPADLPAGSFALQLRAVANPFDGWLYFVSGSQEEPASNIDRLAITALEDGRMLLAVLRKGYKQGLYNLVLVPSTDVLENSKVAWCARVLWILPT